MGSRDAEQEERKFPNFFVCFGGTWIVRYKQINDIIFTSLSAIVATLWSEINTKKPSYRKSHNNKK